MGRVNLDLSCERKITKEQLVLDLKKMGLGSGDHVGVALAFKSLGFVVGGPKTLIEALLEVVGSKGTLMMNTHTMAFPVSEILKDFVFDKDTKCWTGVVPETLRKREDAIRSTNPLTSVVAIGRFAETLTKDHDEKSSLYLPYSRLARIGGKYLCIGIGYNIVAIRHLAQFEAGLFDVVKRFYGVKYRNQMGEGGLFVYNKPPCKEKLPDIARYLETKGIIKKGKIGNTSSFICNVDEFVKGHVSILRKSPQVGLCQGILCLWCRETERKLNLYSYIRNPRFFQKYRFFIIILGLVNKLRLKNYNYLMFSDRKIEDLKLDRFYWLRIEFEGLLRSIYLLFRAIFF